MRIEGIPVAGRTVRTGDIRPAAGRTGRMVAVAAWGRTVSVLDGTRMRLG